MISIKKYNKKYFNLWNSFVDSSCNGTIFQNKKFLSYHITRSFIDCSLLFYHNSVLCALLPAALIVKNKKSILYSHPGASYGGFIFKKNTDFLILDNIIKALEKYCINKKIDEILLINTPQTYFLQKDESIDYLLHWNNYLKKEVYISHVIELTKMSKTIDLLKKRKKRYVKNSINKNNYQYRESCDFSFFYALLKKNKKKYNSHPTHSLDELKKIKKIFPEQIKLIVAIDDNQIIGGTLLFYLNKKISLVFYNIIDESYRKTQLATFQLVNAMQISKKLGYTIMDLGVSHTPEMKNPLAPKVSLIQFKEQFGATGIIRNVYEKKINDEKK